MARLRESVVSGVNCLATASLCAIGAVAVVFVCCRGYYAYMDAYYPNVWTPEQGWHYVSPANRDKRTRTCLCPDPCPCKMCKCGQVVACDTCEGDGKVEGQPCDMCDSTGELVINSGKSRVKSKCPLCLGTGKQIGVCPICGGSGKMIQESPGVLRNVPKKP